MIHKSDVYNLRTQVYIVVYKSVQKSKHVYKQVHMLDSRRTQKDYM